MTDTKPLDVLLNEVGEYPSNDALEKILPQEPVGYVLTSDQWGALKTGNEMLLLDAMTSMDFPAYQARSRAINELVQAFIDNSEPRFTDVPETDPKPDEDVTVTLSVVLFLELFAGFHTAWHAANGDGVEFGNDDAERNAEIVALINATHTRALAYVQPWTDHFNHTSDGKGL